MSKLVELDLYQKVSSDLLKLTSKFTITDVRMIEFHKDNGKVQKRVKLILDNKYQFVLNITNEFILINRYGRNTDDWKLKNIELYEKDYMVQGVSKKGFLIKE